MSPQLLLSCDKGCYPALCGTVFMSIPVTLYMEVHVSLGMHMCVFAFALIEGQS